MPTTNYRQLLLAVIADHDPNSGSLQASTVLNEAGRRVGTRLDAAEQEALLTAWYDLFRTGLLSWGYNLSNPNPPHSHTTDVGRRALKQLSRDPYNPDGYLGGISSHISAFPIAKSYIEEAIAAFVSGLFRAAAVLSGAATERLVLTTRDSLVARIVAAGGSPDKKLQDWRVKTARDAVDDLLVAREPDLKKAKLWERYSAFFVPVSDQIRMVRNDAGHPSSIDPISESIVHGNLLLFPEFLSLATDLIGWIKSSY